MLFRICFSIENWLAADARNVAVVHCMVRAPARRPAVGGALARC
jgi:hypothetical protein